MNRNTQLVCPNCRHEFQYAGGELDARIAQLANEIQDIMHQLAKHKALPKAEQYARTEWWRKAKISLAYRQKEVGRLKAIRKVGHEQRNRAEDMAFRDAVKELYGHDEYMRCVRLSEEMTAGYRLPDMARTEYSHKGRSGITSAGKL